MQKQEKLLLVGGDIATPDVIKYCREIGVYTIMTNDIPRENNPYKQIADEAWEIPVEELDILEAKCKEVGVTGVFAGVNEHNLDMTQALSKRLGLPFYASDEGWACARDKGRFKAHCVAVGLDVAKRYDLMLPFSSDVLAQIHYPIVVKPADACAQRGLSVCHCEEELLPAYEKALSFSSSGEIIVEDFLEGIELDLTYVFVNEKPILNKCYLTNPIYYGGRPIFSLCLPSISFWNKFEEKHGAQIEALTKRMDCKYGTMVLQLIYSNEKYYLLEMGYRLDGTASWRNNKRQTGFSACEYLVDVQLGRDLNHWHPLIGIKNPSTYNTSYLLYAKPGKVNKIVGLDAISKLENIDITLSRFSEGSVIEAAGNMYQVAYFFLLLDKDKESMASQIKYINETLHFYDENGNDLLIYFDDYSVFESDANS